MSGNNRRSTTSTTWRRGATASVSTPVLDQLFATLTPATSARSHGGGSLWRDGTDPLLGGHDGAPGGHHMASVRLGGPA